MALTQSLTCKVRNISESTKAFSFLPPHGKTLESGEEYTIDGDLMAYLAKNKRKLKAFNDAIDGTTNRDATLALVRSVNPHYYDPVLHQTVVLEVRNSVVNDVAPSEGHYASSGM